MRRSHMEPIDTWRAADQMVKLHGVDAAIKAALRANALLDQGDADGFEAWKRIATAINELQRVRPVTGEPVH